MMNLYAYIAADSGHHRAEAYINRILDNLQGLETFPVRGTAREDIRPGLRLIGFERRATIAFRVLSEKVEILRVLYGGQDIEARLAD